MTEGSLRLFFACWPNDDISAAFQTWIRKLRKRVSGRAISQANIHLTLNFIGQADLKQQLLLSQVAFGTEFPRCELIFDRLEFMEKNRIIWASCSNPSTRLKEFVDKFRSRLRQNGFNIEARGFLPHVTLFRKAQEQPTQRLKPIPWSIDSFCLVSSKTDHSGAKYEILNRWYGVDDVK